MGARPAQGHSRAQRRLGEDLVPVRQPRLDGGDVLLQVDAQRRELDDDVRRLVRRRLLVRLDDVRRGDAALQLLAEELGDLRLVELDVAVADDRGEVGGAQVRQQLAPRRRALGEQPLEEREVVEVGVCLLYTSPSPRDKRQSRMPSSA